VSELPKGWVSGLLGDLVKVERGSSPRPIKHFITEGEGVNWIKIGDMKEGKKYVTSTRDKITKEGALKSRFVGIGDFILSNSMSFGRPYIMNIDGYIHDGWFAIRLPSEIDTNYFYYLLSSSYIQNQFNQLAVGGVVKNISGDLVKKASLPLPPQTEQKRIVEKLDQVLAQVDTIKALLDGIPAILKRFRQSVLAAAVSGKLTEEWRRENSLSMSSWLFDCAKNVCEKVQSGSTPRNSPFDQNGTIPFLKVYNIVNQEINFDYKPQFVTQDVHGKALLRSVALPNDVLMNIVGPPLGKVAILTNQYPEWNINQAITLFRVNENNFSYKFLYYILCEGELVRKVMPDTKGSVGQVNISLSQCRDAIMPVPPIEEQTEIVRLVDGYFAFADTIEKQVQKAQQRVDKLTQSILAKAFRGELVPQNPTDEPADELLKRIATARAEAEALALSAKKTAKKVGKESVK
jgi:type I restriction enzyme S subunit